MINASILELVWCLVRIYFGLAGIIIGVLGMVFVCSGHQKEVMFDV